MPIMTIKPIRNADDLRTSKTRLAYLLSKSNGREHDDEIEVLTTLIERFEEKYAPIDTPDPIAAIKYRMEERGLSPRQLEPFIGSRARVSEVLSGKRQLSIDMIRSLHEGIGIPYESLISNRSNKSDLDQISGSAIERLNTLGFNLNRNEIPTFISSSLREGAPVALLRRTRTQRAASKTDQGALLLWQAAVLQKCEAMLPLTVFEPSKLSSNDLRQIAKMSARDDGPRRAVDELTNKGICVVVMPPLPGTFLDGAAMASPSGALVVALTLRHDRIDNFWFTLLHELAHICLHFKMLLNTHNAFFDDMEIQSEDAYEQEADTLARESLIPKEILSQVVWSHASVHDDLVTVATRARVHLAVVAGRWQRDHQNYKKFSRLIDRNSVKSLLIENCTNVDE
jgi:HTH-type transcriptional regulator/antitoxin HigA